MLGTTGFIDKSKKYPSVSPRGTVRLCNGQARNASSVHELGRVTMWERVDVSTTLASRG